MNDPLAALRPLHLPAAVSWWPPAPGWWLLAVLAGLLGGAAVWYYRRTALRRVALAELQRLQHQVTDDVALTAALNQLLRRVALARFPRTQVAALSGTDWLQFLETRTSGFVSGPGRVLAAAPYQRGSTVDRAALVALAQRWIRRACGRRP
jgi:hypothetical protein